MIQTDSDGNMMICIMFYGKPRMVFLHVYENSLVYRFSISLFNPPRIRIHEWIYNKNIYKTFNDAVKKYIEELNAYYSEEE